MLALPERFAPITLAEVEAGGAALQDRVDRKYLVPVDRLVALAERLEATHRALTIAGVRVFRYDTAYFDTPGLERFRDHVQGRRRRFKCRTRRYSPGDACRFEVKCKGARGRTVKHRLPYGADRHGRLDAEALAFLAAVLAGDAPRAPLGHVLTVRQTRFTLVAPELGERLTVDAELAFAGPGGSAALRSDTVIVESKSAAGGAVADRLLRELGVRPAEGCSKFCLGVALTHPGVRANIQRPLLRRYFAAPSAASSQAARRPSHAFT